MWMCLMPVCVVHFNSSSGCLLFFFCIFVVINHFIFLLSIAENQGKISTWIRSQSENVKLLNTQSNRKIGENNSRNDNFNIFTINLKHFTKPITAG